MAIGTWALVVITLGAVLVGTWAAFSAAAAYRLESEPVVAVSLVESQEEGATRARSVPTSYVVIGTPLLADGIELRRLTKNEARQRTGGSGMPRPHILLQVQNLGRSPAIGLVLRMRASAATLSSGTDIEESQDHFRGFETSEQTTVGDVEILGIPAQSSAYVRIYHDFGIAVTLSVAEDGLISTISGGVKCPKGRLVAVVVSAERFVIPDPTTYAHMVAQTAEQS